jgi:DNA-directed RNA polymerase specialized sigma24 family protein
VAHSPADDPDALFTRHLLELRRKGRIACLRYTTSEDDIQEWVQDALVVVWTNRGVWSPTQGAGWVTWARVVMERRIAQLARSAKRRPVPHEAAEEMSDQAQASADPEQDVIRELGLAIVGARMKDIEADLSVLRLLSEGKSQLDICRELGAMRRDVARRMVLLRRLTAELGYDKHFGVEKRGNGKAS